MPARTIPPSRNDIRDDVPDRGATVTVPCPVCRTAFTPIRRQKYCTQACRQTAWRIRHPNSSSPPAAVLPPATRRRDHTVYQCPSCGTRRLGQQWCPDCTHPALRVDLGGLCPHCDEPVTISDLTDQHPDPPTSR
jgi:hypothetical protein